ncbi:uncharacterized protein N7482_004663 [Penicillium canariense]|uniref:Anaphase-promoting complex, subunit 15/MND2 n=1 Tax=Penicillium canariense TaxID=189055 RepID=A0A9W9I938_9EURO|nr:uncharacterized protein N7482_004663 [Penicillium canariense]KAJ5169069.1 hypothetical protein N7482_004663 [Penicillium canariense]
MLSLPFITPQDSHELWFGPSQPSRFIQQSNPDASTQHARRNAPNPSTHRAFLPSRSPANSLAALQMEERTLRARKQNIASFGSSWIRPAGCAKTMLGMKEEEAEREEALAAAAAEMGAVDTEGLMDDDMGMTQGEGEEEGEGMERDLDDEIPDAEEGLVEEGEEGLAEDGLDDEEGFMERDLDDDIPEGYEESGEESGLYVDEDFDNAPDLDAEVPEGSEAPSRDLDDEIPDAVEEGSEQEGEWQHTDTEEESDADETENEHENDDENEVDVTREHFAENFRTSTPNSRGLPPPLMRRERPGETEAQRRFINRWSGGGDAFDSSSMLFEEDDLRASLTSQSSQRSGLSRHFPRRVGGPRDSLN